MFLDTQSITRRHLIGAARFGMAPILPIPDHPAPQHAKETPPYSPQSEAEKARCGGRTYVIQGPAGKAWGSGAFSRNNRYSLNLDAV